MDRRFVELTGGSFDDAEIFAAFSDVFDAVCAPPHTQFIPSRDRCRLDPVGRSLRIAGTVTTTKGERVAEVDRKLDFGSRLAHHAMLVVNPEFRNAGLAAVFVLHSIEFYESVGIREIHLQAALTTGPYYWARLGFQFASDPDAELIRTWAARVNAKLGCGLDCRQARTPYQWSQLGNDEGVTLTLGAVAANFADEAERIRVRATDIRIALDEPLHFGKAMLLSGPAWRARLPVSRASKSLLQNYLAGRAERAQIALLERANPS
jgi:GNAT superfamily N-acetyltransferase